MKNNILIISDNEFLIEAFRELKSVKYLSAKNFIFDYRFSFSNVDLIEKYSGFEWISSLEIKKNVAQLSERYGLIISLHCKQLFPVELINKVRCINVHPGFNPHNRGWFPQVFSIINKKPCGVTIHEIDEELDHGSVIVREMVPVFSWDTSFSLYERLLQKELELLDKYIEDIVVSRYVAVPVEEGNVNYKKDFRNLCEIDLNESGTWGDHIDRLRALSHNGYRNAYFFDEKGKRVYINIQLTPAE
jgi:methionyl-tRNA formyltransferase